MYKEYEGIVESHLRHFAKLENMSRRELFNRIKSSAEENELAQLLVELILCTTDFQMFCELMKIKFNEQKIISNNPDSFESSENLKPVEDIDKESINNFEEKRESEREAKM